MFTKNVFTQKDPIAEAIAKIAEADYKSKMEELKGNQKVLDKNKNNKLDSQDFAILRGEKKAVKEEEQVDESKFNPLKHIKNPSPAVKTAAKDVKRGSYADRAALMKAGGVKDDRGPRGVTQEEVEEVDESSPFDWKKPREPEVKGGAGIKKGRAYGGAAQKSKPEQDDADDKKKTQKEEVEQIEEGDRQTLTKKLINRAYRIDKGIGQLAKKQNKTGIKSGLSDTKSDMRKAVKGASDDTVKKMMKKEEVEQVDEKVISSELQTIQGNHVVNSQTHTHPDAKHGVSSDTLVHKGTISSKGGSNKKKFEIHNHPNHGLVFKTNHTDDEKQSIKKHLIYNKMAGKGTAMQEEVEQFDELNRSTVKSYIDKKMDKIHSSAGTTSSLPGAKDLDSLQRAHARLVGNKPTTAKKTGDIQVDVRNKKVTKNEEVEHLDEAMNDDLHPVGVALLKHIKPEHHNLYKPYLTSDVFNGSFKDRHDVLTAAKQAGHLKEEVEELDERELSKGETAEKERIVKGMKKSLAGFKARYGDRAKSVMYATATARAKK